MTSRVRTGTGRNGESPESSPGRRICFFRPFLAISWNGSRGRIATSRLLDFTWSPYVSALSKTEHKQARASAGHPAMAMAQELEVDWSAKNIRMAEAAPSIVGSLLE